MNTNANPMMLTGGTLVPDPGGNCPPRLGAEGLLGLGQRSVPSGRAVTQGFQMGATTRALLVSCIVPSARYLYWPTAWYEYRGGRSEERRVGKEGRFRWVA